MNAVDTRPDRKGDQADGQTEIAAHVVCLRTNDLCLDRKLRILRNRVNLPDKEIAAFSV